MGEDKRIRAKFFTQTGDFRRKNARLGGGAWNPASSFKDRERIGRQRLRCRWVRSRRRTTVGNRIHISKTRPSGRYETKKFGRYVDRSFASSIDRLVKQYGRTKDTTKYHPAPQRY